MTICIAVIFISARFRSPVIFHRLRGPSQTALSQRRAAVAGAVRRAEKQAGGADETARHCGPVLCLLMAGVLGRGRERGARSAKPRRPELLGRSFARPGASGVPGAPGHREPARRCS